MVGGRTGAERYLAERLKDPEYAAEYGEASAVLAAGQPCGPCDGSPCDGGCRPACRHKYDGPDSHRVCGRCGGTGTEQR